MAENKSLSTIFTGAAIGLAVAFATEFFTFPFFHNSIPGQSFVSLANEWLLPLYNGIGTALGMSAPSVAVSGIPTVSF